jgi:murein L,D-transpeptidase YafK
MHPLARTALLLIAALLLAGPGPEAAHAEQSAPPAMAPATTQADSVTLDKGARRLTLWRGARVLARYPVSLGAAPDGHKTRAGDARTPEGRYIIDWRNAASRFHLSLHISYPNAADRAAAHARGEDPGGMIMIHGLPEGAGWLGRLHLLRDWTDGCIAVTNPQMREIWTLVPNGTPITIRP